MPERAERARLPRSARLTRGTELRAVLQEGKRIRTEHLDVRAAASLLHHPRVGFIVPKHKQSGVARNRLKRRLRELARLRLLPALRHVPPLDVVIRTRPEAYGASFAALERDVVHALGRMGQGVGGAGRAARRRGAEGDGRDATAAGRPAE